MGLPAQKLDSAPARSYTVDEYLERERKADSRSYYIDGQAIAMSGESLAHGDISVNLVILLGSLLRRTPCRVLTKDIKVRSGPTPMAGTSRKGMFSYPDLLVVCGEVEFHDAVRDIILNPTVAIEVLSPSSEKFDRGEKFIRFRKWNPTLRDYVLVAQDHPWIEVYSAQENGKWLLSSYEGLEASVTIPSIQCSLKLSEVYERVSFSVERPPEATETAS